MDVSRTHTFDAPLDAVWAMFRDREAHVEKFSSMGHRDIEVLDFDADDDHVRIEVRRVVDIEVPGFAKKVIKPSNTVTSIDEWQRDADGSCSGHYSVESGTPIKVEGTTRITADGDDRTRYEITVSLTVSVPLIGGKIANFAKGDIEKQIKAEFACGDAWLAGAA